MPPIIICHGTPYKVNEKLLPGDDRTMEIMNSVNTSVIRIKSCSCWNATFSEGKTQFLILHANDDTLYYGTRIFHADYKE